MPRKRASRYVSISYDLTLNSSSLPRKRACSHAPYEHNTQDITPPWMNRRYDFYPNDRRTRNESQSLRFVRRSAFALTPSSRIPPSNFVEGGVLRTHGTRTQSYAVERERHTRYYGIGYTSTGSVLVLSSMIRDTRHYVSNPPYFLILDPRLKFLPNKAGYRLHYFQYFEMAFLCFVQIYKCDRNIMHTRTNVGAVYTACSTLQP